MLKIIDLDIHNEKALKEINEIFKLTWNDSIEESLKKHIGYEGFQCILLQIEEETIGFAYGYSSVPGQYYHDLLHRHLSTQDYESYLTDCFEFVELAVLPEYRKKGFGARLTSCLLNQTHHQNAVLTTQYENHRAKHLYHTLGWMTLDDTFIPRDERYVIMAKKLNK